MKQAAKVAMTPADIESAMTMFANGASDAEVSAALGRHIRTVRRIRKDGARIAAARSAPRRRVPMSAEVRLSLRDAALGRGRLKPAHVTAEMWSDAWFDQQQSAFAEAMGRAHPDVKACVAARTLLAHQRITEATETRLPPFANCGGGLLDQEPAPHGAGVADGLAGEVRQKATRGGS